MLKWKLNVFQKCLQVRKMYCHVFKRISTNISSDILVQILSRSASPPEMSSLKQRLILEWLEL